MIFASRQSAGLFVVLFVVFLMLLYILYYTSPSDRGAGTSSVWSCPYKWHGGVPDARQPGSCWCGHSDSYCMCTPSLAIDAIIEYAAPSTSYAPNEDISIVLVYRRDPPSALYAIPGGFVQVGKESP